jgi:uncharacterized membrane protein YfcA
LTWLLGIVLGLLVGLALGALGGGGSILTVPILVYVMALSPQEAITASLVIVGTTSVISAVGHARLRNVRWKQGAIFGAVGIPAAYLGTLLNGQIDPQILLTAFAGVMLASAAAMLLRSRRRRATERSAARVPATARQADSQSSRAQIDRDAAEPPAVLQDCPRRRRTSLVWLQIAATGLGIGFLTGFFGVGGGFLIVPALVMILGYEMPAAIGTSLLVIAIDSAASLAARTGADQFDWAVIAPFGLLAIAGSFLGRRIASRLPNRTLTQAFAVLIVLVAAYTLIKAI